MCHLQENIIIITTTTVTTAATISTWKRPAEVLKPEASPP